MWPLASTITLAGLMSRWIDARLVREVERLEQLAHHAEDRLQVEALLRVEGVLELLALDVLHDDVVEVALGAEVVHLHDVGVVQPSRRRAPRA